MRTDTMGFTVWNGCEQSDGSHQYDMQRSPGYDYAPYLDRHKP